MKGRYGQVERAANVLISIKNLNTQLWKTLCTTSIETTKEKE